MSDAVAPVTPIRHRVVVIGGGNGGVSIAARLRRRGVTDIAIVEPRGAHHYKPLFSHVAGGTARASETVRSQRSVIPPGVRWIRDAVAEVHPEDHAVSLSDGTRVEYDQLIVSPGIQLDWDRIPGLTAALDTPAVSSHYRFDLAKKTSRLLRDVTSGTVVFVQPDGPASCAGAGQKPMYQACDYWRARGVLGDIRVVLVVPTRTVFLAPFDEELERKIAEYGIELRTSTTLAAVDGEAQTLTLDGPGGREDLAFDVLNVEPPQSAPDWLKASALPATGDDGGFVEVDPGRSGIRASPTSGRSATRRRAPTPSAAALCASRRGRWRRTSSPSSRAARHPLATTATACARSRCRDRASCGRSSTTTVRRSPRSRSSAGCTARAGCHGSPTGTSSPGSTGT